MTVAQRRVSVEPDASTRVTAEFRKVAQGRGRSTRTHRRRYAVALCVAVGDAAAAVAAVLVTGPHLASSVTFAASALLVIWSLGGYRVETAMGPTFRSFARLCVAVALTNWATTLVTATAGLSFSSYRLALASLPLPLAWWLARALAAKVRSRPDNVVIVGSGLVASRAILRVQSANQCVVGWIDDDPQTWPAAPYLGSTASLPRIIADYDVDRVLVAFSASRDDEIARVLRDCDECDVEIDIVSRLFDCLPPEATVRTVAGLPALRVPAGRASQPARIAKRCTDLLLATILLVVVLPVLVAVAASVWIGDGLPVIYRQRRVGRNGVEFEILKFRTMVRSADAEGAQRIAGLALGEISVADAVATLKPDADPRLTRVGGFLRKWSFDELPQLLNVLQGNMSLVGPRPLREFEVDALHSWQLVRQNVKPGITGLWQVRGRSTVAWDERMQLDYSYVRHWRPASDIRILARTVPAVLSRRGAK